jgi:putative nucleotidyltransferase with HDIG domain
VIYGGNSTAIDDFIVPADGYDDRVPVSASATILQPTTRLRVLFVDDEPHVLAGLQRSFRSHRDNWDTRFTNSGAAALVELAQTPADVLVSDMRMPVMSGGDLLTAVMERWPAIVRVILSGHADLELVHRTIGSAHQFLRKPCNAPTVGALVQGIWHLRHSLTNTVLHRLVGGMRAIPCMPEPHAALLELLNASQPRMDLIATTIASDPGMSVRVLHLVNSAFFGQRRTIASPTQAAHMLGAATLRALVQTTPAFERIAIGKRTWFDPAALWQHSLRVARLAKRIAIALDLPPTQVDEAILAGLVHDVGHLVLAAHCPNEHAILARRTRHEGDILTERMMVGGSHAEIGAYLLGLWGLPLGVVYAIASHHDPQASPSAHRDPLTCVHVADALVHHHEGHPTCNVLAMDYLTTLGLIEYLPIWTTWAASCGDAPGRADHEAI